MINNYFGCFASSSSNYEFSLNEFDYGKKNTVLPVFPEDDAIAGKTTKPFYMHFLKRNEITPFFLLFFWLTVKVWQRQSSGATRAPTPKQLEKGESGETF